MSIVPALIGVVSFALFCFYPLNEAKMLQIEGELKARRASEAAGAEPAASGS
jgi:Na+/melibiose symporter-like transporter